MKIFRISAILIWVVCTQFAALAQQAYYHPSGDYFFTIPTDWDTIPAKEIISMSRMLNPTADATGQEAFDGGLTYFNDSSDYFLTPYVLFKYYKEPNVMQLSIAELEEELSLGFRQLNQQLYLDFLNQRRIDLQRKAIFFDYSMASEPDSLRLISGYFIGPRGVVSVICYAHHSEYLYFREDFSTLFESVNVPFSYQDDSLEAKEEIDTYDEDWLSDGGIYEPGNDSKNNLLIFIISILVLILVAGFLVLRWRKKKARLVQSPGERSEKEVAPVARRAGKMYKRTGIFLVIFSLILGQLSRLAEAEVALSIWVFSISLFFLGVFLFWRGRQFSDKAMAEEVLHDTKPDVLYLRAFKADPTMYKKIFSAVLTPNLVSGLTTEEEQLREAVAPFGDLVAIGKPGEGLPTPGAARLYASNEEWQEIVTEKMREATLVIIRAGEGSGLYWELTQAFNIVDPQKLLILVMGLKKQEYNSFSLQAQSIFGVAFPTVKKMKKVVFIRFSKDWIPEVLVPKIPYFRRSAYRPLGRIFKYGLAPVYRHFNIMWEPAKISWLTVVSVVILILFGLLFLSLFITSLYG